MWGWGGGKRHRNDPRPLGVRRWARWGRVVAVAASAGTLPSDSSRARACAFAWGVRHGGCCAAGTGGGRGDGGASRPKGWRFGRRRPSAPRSARLATPHTRPGVMFSPPHDNRAGASEQDKSSTIARGGGVSGTLLERSSFSNPPTSASGTPLHTLTATFARHRRQPPHTASRHGDSQPQISGADPRLPPPRSTKALGRRPLPPSDCLWPHSRVGRLQNGALPLALPRAPRPDHRRLQDLRAARWGPLGVCRRRAAA